MFGSRGRGVFQLWQAAEAFPAYASLFSSGPRGWVMPTGTGKGHLVYSSTNSNASFSWKHPQQTHPEIMFYQLAGYPLSPVKLTDEKNHHDVFYENSDASNGKYKSSNSSWHQSQDCLHRENHPMSAYMCK